MEHPRKFLIACQIRNNVDITLSYIDSTAGLDTVAAADRLEFIRIRKLIEYIFTAVSIIQYLTPCAQATGIRITIHQYLIQQGDIIAIRQVLIHEFIREEESMRNFLCVIAAV